MKRGLVLLLCVAGCDAPTFDGALPIGSHRLAALADLAVGEERATSVPVAVPLGWHPTLASNGVTTAAVLHYDSTVYVGRVDRSGVALDPLGIDVTTVLSDQAADSARITSNGTDYLVVWEQGDIHGARVSAEGVLLDTTPISILVDTSLESVQTGPGLGSNGTDYLVAWESFDANGDTARDIFAGRVAADGTVLDAGGVPIAIASGNQLTPVVASVGTTYVVAWHDAEAGDVLAARVGFDGAVTDPGGFSLGAGSPPRDPRIASNGSTAIVAWTEDGGGVHYRMVDATGALGTPEVLPGADTPSSGDLAVASDGSGFLCIWKSSLSNRVLAGARVDASGAVIGTNPAFELEEFFSEPSLTFDGTQYVIAYESGSRGARTLRVDTAGLLVDSEELGIIGRNNEQWGQAVAWDGAEFLLAWQDDRPPDKLARFARLDAEGAPVSGTEAEVAVPSAGPLAVASNGSSVAISFTTTGVSDPRFGTFPMIHTRVLGTDGVLSDAVSGCLGELACGFATQAASDGDAYLIATTALRTSGSPLVSAFRLDGSGALLDSYALQLANAPVGSPAPGELSPAVAFDGTHYAVLWNEAGTAIVGKFVAPDSGLLTMGTITLAAEPEDRVKVASDGVVLLAVWKDLREPVGIRAARIALDGRVYDPDGIVLATGEALRSPSVAFGGTTFVVMYADTAADGRILATRVSQGGGADTPPVVIATETGGGVPVVVGTGSDRWLVAYGREDVSGPEPAYRVYTRIVECGAGSGDCAPTGDGLPPLPDPPPTADAAPLPSDSGADAATPDAGATVDVSSDSVLGVGQAPASCDCRFGRSTGPGGRSLLGTLALCWLLVWRRGVERERKAEADPWLTQECSYVARVNATVPATKMSPAPLTAGDRSSTGDGASKGPLKPGPAARWGGGGTSQVEARKPSVRVFDLIERCCRIDE